MAPYQRAICPDMPAKCVESNQYLRANGPMYLMGHYYGAIGPIGPVTQVKPKAMHCNAMAIKR